MSITNIEWADKVWNPTTGCTKVSDGCKNCYAERMAKRLKGMGLPKYDLGFDVQTHKNELDKPRHWKKGCRVFVDSMGDLFHPEVPDYFIRLVFQVMNECPQHTFMVLTKYAGRMDVECNNTYDQVTLTPNIWMGVSVEDHTHFDRINLLPRKAAIRFVSFEPLLGPVGHRIGSVQFRELGWVIAGGESGPGYRPVRVQWLREIRDACVHYSVPFFFKGWGGNYSNTHGRFLDGRTWDYTPNEPF